MKKIILILLLSTKLVYGVCEKKDLFENSSFGENCLKCSINKVIKLFSSFENRLTPLKCIIIPPPLIGDRNKTIDSKKYLPKPHSQVGQISIVTSEEADQIFKKLKEDYRIPYKFNLEGCFSRAHAMAKILESEMGLISGKAFFANDLIFKSKLDSNEYIYPITHATTFLFVKDKNGKIGPYIFDPSVADKPMSLEKFQNKISLGNKTVVQFTDRFQYNYNTEYQKTNIHPDPRSNWDLNEGAKAYQELRDFKMAIPYFENGKCGGEEIGNIIGLTVPDGSYQKIIEACLILKEKK